jgi:spermidine synthase
MQRAVAPPARINRDFEPVLYFYHLRHWMSQFPLRLSWLAAGVVAAALGAYLFSLKPVGLTIFASGFTGAALSVVLLLGFQVLCGLLYRQVGVIVTVFMAGLAAGAWWVNRTRGCAPVSRPRTDSDCAVSNDTGDLTVKLSTGSGDPRRTLRDPRRTLIELAFAIAGVAAALPWALQAMGAWPLMGVQVGVALLTLVLAMLVGMQFPMATRSQFDGGATTASRLYTADFVGACLGAFLASTLLIPIIGVAATCWLTAGLNVVAGLLLFRRGQ